MNNEEIHSQEIQSRIDSDIWSQKIARNVSGKFERQQNRNRLLFSVSAFLLAGILFAFSYLSPNDFLDSNLTELDTYRLFLSDDFSPLYETIYEDENISSLIEPISFLIK